MYGPAHNPGNQHLDTLRNLLFTQQSLPLKIRCRQMILVMPKVTRGRFPERPFPCLTANLLVMNFQVEMYTHLLPMCQSWKMAQWGQFTKQRYFRKASWNCLARGSTKRSAFSPHILSRALQSAFSASNSRPGICSNNTVFPKGRRMVIYAFSQNLPKLQHAPQAQRWNFSLHNTLKTWSSTVSIPDGKAVFIKK